MGQNSFWQMHALEPKMRSAHPHVKYLPKLELLFRDLSINVQIHIVMCQNVNPCKYPRKQSFLSYMNITVKD